MGIAGWNPKVKYRGGQGVLRRAREEAPEGAGPLGERLRVRVAADPGALRGRGRPRPAEDQGHARRHRVLRRWPGRSSSSRARTWPPRASSGSGRRTSSSSCGPRPRPPGPRWCRSRPGRDALAHPAAGRRGRGIHDGGHLRPRRPRPQSPVRPHAGAERGARRVPDAGRLRHVLAAHRLGRQPAADPLDHGPDGLRRRARAAPPALRPAAGRRGGREPRVALAPALLRPHVRDPERGAPDLERGSQGLQLSRHPAAVARHRLPRQPRPRGRDRPRPGRGLLPLSPLQPDRQGGARPDAGAGGRAAHGHPDLADPRRSASARASRCPR